MKKIGLLLLSIIFLQIITSCAADIVENIGSVAGDTDHVETTAAITDNRSLIDDLPNMDYEGYTFSMHTRTQPHFQSAIMVEEQNGETLNDAIYDRNIAIEERFNIQFYEIYDPNSSSPTTTARKVILAGDDTYDMLILGGSGLMDLAVEGLIYSVSELPYIDLTKDYWDHTVNDELSFCGEQYFASGAMNLTSYDFTHVLCFNKTMINDLNIENPYQLIEEGKWTYDKFAELGAKAVLDIDGDGEMTSSDSFGLLSAPKQVMPNFWIGAGERSVDRNDNDEPVFQIAGDERYLSVFNKIFEVTHDTGVWFPSDINTQFSADFNRMFQDNRGLFYDSTFFYVASLRDMESDFGIIPYPKYEEHQENYYSRIETIISFIVPKTNTNLDRTSVIIEALASESAKTVIPAYYEIALKTKYTRDEESEKMLDLIFENRMIDLGDCIWFSIYRDGVISSMYRNNDRDISSKLASLQSKMDTTLADVTDAFIKLKDVA